MKGKVIFFLIAVVITICLDSTLVFQAKGNPAKGGELKGLYTVGSNGAYVNLTAVAAALNSSVVTADVVFELQADYDGTVGETFPVTFNHTTFSGAANWKIIIRPAADVTSMLTTSGDPGVFLPLILLKGAKYITFDGRPGGKCTDNSSNIQSNSKWTIINKRTTTATIGSTMQLEGDAAHDTLRYLTLKGDATHDTVVNYNDHYGVVSVFNPDTIGSAYSSVDHNIITNFNAAYPAFGIMYYNIYYSHQTNELNLSDNEITNIYNAAIYIDGDGDCMNWKICNNSIFNTTGNKNAATDFGIKILVSDINVAGTILISGNYIGGTAAKCAGDKWNNYTSNGFHAIDVYSYYSSVLPVISNNVITNINMNNTNAMFVGIYTKANNKTFTIKQNIIGDPLVKNSITSSGEFSFRGIYTINTYKTYISDNIVANFTLTGSATNKTAIIIAMDINNGINVISGNVIHDLYTNAGPNNVTTPAVCAIDLSSKLSNQLIQKNIMYNLYFTVQAKATAGVFLNAMQLTTLGDTNNIIDANYIHNIFALNPSSVSNATTIKGIYIYKASSDAFGFRFSNNMIALGYDNQATPTNDLYYGIMEAGGKSNFYFNTIYIGGTGTYESDNLWSSVMSGARAIENNIFYNSRTGTTASQKAISVNFYLGVISDYNIYWTVSPFNLNTYRDSYLANDLHSVVANPGFISTSGDNSLLNLRLQGETVAEGNGIEIPEITTDFDGNLRNSLSPVDIGAAAGDFIKLDLFPPIISYNNVPNCIPSSNFVLNDVKITDLGEGVPAFSAYSPRVWYRKNNNSWFSTQGFLKSGDKNNAVWSFNLDFNLDGFGGNTVAGDIIYYYIVAQDMAATPNLAYNPATGASHSNVFTQISPPSSPNKISVQSPVVGDYYVGTAQQFTSLTSNDSKGFFNYLNTHSIIGDVNVYITSNLTENGAVPLYKPVYSDNTNYNITIKPMDNSTKVISGSKSAYAGLITFSGAQYITVDGSFNGSGQYLTFRNIRTDTIHMSTFYFYKDANNITVKNCIIEGNTHSSTDGIISFGAPVFNGNNYITISGNLIQPNSLAKDYPTNAIASCFNYKYKNNYITISNNYIRNWSVNASGYKKPATAIKVIGTGNGNNWTISGNHLYNDNIDSKGSQTAIDFQPDTSSAANVISGNYIGGNLPYCQGKTGWSNSFLKATMTVINIAVGDAHPCLITANTFQNIIQSNQTEGTLIGIHIIKGAVTITNNLFGHPDSLYSINCMAGTLDKYLGGLTNIIISETTAIAPIIIKNNNFKNIFSTGYYNASMRLIELKGLANTFINSNNFTDIYSFGPNYDNQHYYNFIISAKVGRKCTIDSNYIYNAGVYPTYTLAVNLDFYGINVNADSVNGSISHNCIGNIAVRYQGNVLKGIYITGNNSNWLISNNMLNINNALNSKFTTPGLLYDIVEVKAFDNYCSGGTTKIYYNTFIVSGAQRGTGYSDYSSYTFFNSSPKFISPVIDMRNNIIINNRTGLTGTFTHHFAVVLEDVNQYKGWITDYNLYASADILGQWEVQKPGYTTSIKTPVLDSNSVMPALVITAPTSTKLNPDSLFINKSFIPGCPDLHINTAKINSYVYAKGTPVSITTDWDNQPRSATAPCIGADEFMSLSTFKISGLVTYDNADATPMKNTIVYLLNKETNKLDSSYTDSTGFYVFYKVSVGNYQLTAKTTMPWSGSNPGDALAINRYYIGLYSFSDNLTQSASDVNADNSIDPGDALYVNRRYISVIDSFKLPDWLFDNPTIIISNSNVSQNIKALCSGDPNASYPDK